jgi:REP element-mobilizing transposase RayT
METPGRSFPAKEIQTGERSEGERAGGTPAPQGDCLAEFVDPRTTPFAPMRCRGELPHLYKDGGSYFVTFRLWDAVAPHAARIDGRTLHTPSAERIAALSEPPLRRGSPILARPDLAMMVQECLRYFDRQRYLLTAWCVMPNHVHSIFTPLAGYNPSDILHSWKSYTAHQAQRLLGTRGAFWERESFDPLIRSLDQFEAFVCYVEQNPVQAGLCRFPEAWPYSSRGYVCGAGVPPASRDTWKSFDR